MTADLVLRILILVAGIFILAITVEDSPETHDDRVDRYILLVLSIIIVICGVIGLLRYIIV